MSVPFHTFLRQRSGQAPSTVGEFWPLANVDTQLLPKTSLLLYGGSDKGEDFGYDEWKAGGLLNLQLKPIFRPHSPDIDKNKEHYLVFGAGYQYSETIQSGSPSHESRNLLTVERGFQAQGVRVVPYASGELFYDGQTHSWNENRYAFGVQLPYKR